MWYMYMYTGPHVRTCRHPNTHVHVLSVLFTIWWLSVRHSRWRSNCQLPELWLNSILSSFCSFFLCHCVAQASFKLAIQPWDYRCVPPCLLCVCQMSYIPSHSCNFMNSCLFWDMAPISEPSSYTQELQNQDLSFICFTLKGINFLSLGQEHTNWSALKTYRPITSHSLSRLCLCI